MGASKIEKKAVEILKKVVNLEEDEILNLLEEPPDPKLGDLAFPCFELAKKLKKNPNEIAKEIVDKTEIPKDSIFSEVKVIGPYVNFFFDKGKLAKYVIEKIKKEKEKFGSGEKKKEKVMIEHSQPNTHKAFHVGHLRNVCLGDSLVRIMKFYGYDVISANYINDTGQHVARCLWCYLKFHKGEEPETRKGEWLGKLYAEATKKLEENPEYKKEVDEIQQKLESKDPKIMELWKKTREWSLEEFRRIYKQLNVDFDVWFYDHELIDNSKKIVEELVKKGIAEESEGAIVVKEEKTGLPTVIIQKSDGTIPYITKDLELAKIKFEKYKIDKSIYVVAAPQTLHFKQLFKILELYGFEQAKKCYHLSYELVMLKTGKMSSREGSVVLYRELFETAKKKIIKEIEKRHELSDEEIDSLAEKIALGALKYAMLKRENNKVIIFDWDEVLSIEGESGPYLQYSLVRAKKILEKAGTEPNFDKLNLLVEEDEFNLIKKMNEFPEIVKKASENYKPHLTAKYAFELSTLFSKFYETCPVIQAEKSIKEARLSLVWTFIQVMRNCLKLLGIDEVDMM
ncbi:MAG: arginine--tRNA ligase [Candidatus Aenigmarchaeota archaeon]|nr:arginine--tRNA ligase [Candidatus Aenigmarchaeota archaeon]